MSRKDEILKLITENKISVKEGLDRISNLKNYYKPTWVPKQINQTVDFMKGKNILVLTDYEQELFQPLQESNTLFIVQEFNKFSEYEKLDVILVFFKSKVHDIALSILKLYQLLISLHIDSLDFFYLYEEEKIIDPVNEAMGSLFCSLQMEKDDLFYHIIQIAKKETLVQSLKNEFKRQNEMQVKYDYKGQRFIKAITAVSQTNSVAPFRDNATYVLSGGAGAIGKKLLKTLTKKYQANYIILGRSKENQKIQAMVKEDSKNGCNVVYYSCNITDENEMRHVSTKIKNQYGDVNGIIHLAAVIHDKMSILKSEKDFLEVIWTKTLGAENLYQEFRSEKLEFITFCSSVSALTGNIGQCDYSYANSYLEALALKINQLEGREIANAVGFPLWENGGMKPIQNSMKSKGISDQEGIDLFLSAYGFDSKVIYYIEQDTLKAMNQMKKKQEVAKPMDNYYREGQLHELSEQYLIKVIAKEMKMSENKLTVEEDLNEIGLDSIMIMEITKDIEMDFGTISKTLFFEYTDVRSLAKALVKSKRDKLETFFTDKLQVFNKKLEKTTPAVPKQEAMEKVPLVKKTTDKRRPCEDIAIVGMAGRYPMSNDMETLWNNLASGKDCIVEIPKNRWDYKKYFNSDKNVRGKSYSKWGGFIDNYNRFDSLFFKISPREADYLDPQERVFLETAWETIEDAGYTRDQLNQFKVGVFVGVMYGHYQLYNVEEGLRGELPVQSSSYSSIANRVSYALNLHGASMAIDTMCSSSLTAIHLACQSIREGESDMALVGGVNISSHPLKYIMLSQQKFLSTDGRCRSFGEGGDGYVPGEGSGAVLLKNFEQAEKDGDRIYAVIKGSGINHGGKTRGYSVPNPVAQTSVIQSTLDKYAIDAKSINYIETHGTGTALGDPIEISGLMTAFGELNENKKSCAIGSIKSNIGHTESASGVVSITKVILQMMHKQLAPSIHSNVLNPNIDFDSVPFYVQRKLEEWKPVQFLEEGKTMRYPRRAGINSFGAGGSNAFVVLEEYEEHRKYDKSSDEILFVLSAKTEERLREYAKIMQNFISHDTVKKGYSVKALNDLLENEVLMLVADSMQIPVAQLDIDVTFESIGLDYILFNQILNRVYDLFIILDRKAVLGVNTIKELASLLVDNYEEIIYTYFEPSFEKEEARELPQLYEMAYMLQTGREQYEHRLAIIVSSYEELSEKLLSYLNFIHTKGIYLTQKNSSNDAISAVLIGKEGDVFIKNLFENHELEKIAILWCSGHLINWKQCYSNLKIRKCTLPTYPFKRELHWIQKTDKQNRIGTNIFPLIDDFVLDANTNGITLKKCIDSRDSVVSDHLVNQQKVLPGVAYIEMVYEAMSKIGKAKQYDIDSIYWLSPVYVKNEAVTIYITIVDESQKKKFEIYTMTDGKRSVHSNGKLIPADKSNMQLEWNDITTEYQEILGKNLYDMFKKSGITYQNIYRGIQSIKVTGDRALASLEIQVNTDDYNLFPGIADSALQAIAVLSKTSGKINVPYFIGKVYLHKRLESKGKVYVTKAKNGNINAVVTDEEGQVCLVFHNIVLRELSTGDENYLYYPIWKETQIIKERKLESVKAVFIYPEEFQKLADKLEKKLKEVTVIQLALSIDDDGEEKVREILKSNADIDEIFFLNGINHEVKDPDDETEFLGSQKRSITSFYHLAKELLESSYSNQKLRLYVITNNTVIVKDYKKVNPYASVLHGFTLSLDKEMKNWFIKCMDIDLFYDNMDHAVIQILSERTMETADLVAFRENQRFIREVHPIHIPMVKESAFIENGVYMIFGGAGGIGGVLAFYLEQNRNANIVLVGRRPINDSIQEKLAKVKQRGGKAIYVQADLGKLEDIKNAIAITKEKFGKINGVIHSALVLKDKSVRFMTEEILYSTLESKVTGSMLLNKAFRNETIDFMLYFSSANALISAAGQSNYSAACTFEDAYSEYQNEQNQYTVKRINWGYWGTVGVVSSDKYNKSLSQKGTQSIEPEEGMQIIEKLLKNDIPVLVPYKADKQMLHTLGIRLNQVIEVNTVAEISKLRILEDSLNLEQQEKIQQRAETFLEFEGVGGVLLLEKFQRMGYFKTASESVPIKQIKEEIGVISRYDRMFMALLSMLKRYHYVKIEKDIVTALPVIAEKKTVETISSLQENVEALTAQYPEIKPYIHLIKVCVEAYPEVLSGKVSHMSIMFPNGSKELVEHIYTGNVLTDLFNKKMAELVKGYVSDVLTKIGNAKVRILEVGAGTGGTSGFILKELQPFQNNVSYTYTDISKSFVEFGRRKFGNDYPFVEFKILNVEESTEQQKTDLGVYDIVVATNVLHATKTIDNTLLQIKYLMKKDAWVIVNEVTAIQDYATLTFGLTDGWWAYEDEYNRLPLSPLLDAKKWKKVMRCNGFTNFTTFGIKGKNDYHSEQSLLIAQSDGITFASAKVENKLVESLPEEQQLKNVSVADKEIVVEKMPSLEKIQNELKYIFSLTLNMDANVFDVYTNVSDYGVDSLVSMEVNRELEKHYSDIPTTFVFDYPTISDMAEYLKEKNQGKEVELDTKSAKEVANPIANVKKGNQQIIKDTIKEVIAKVLNMDRNDIGDQTPLEEYGVDSLVTMEIVNHIAEFYTSINAQMLLNEATIVSIAEQIEKAELSNEQVQKSNTSIKIVNHYKSTQDEKFYMFWNDLDKKIDLKRYVDGLQEINSLSRLNKQEIQHVIIQDGIHFDIEALVAGSGKPVVFIPGYGVTGVQWKKQIDFFKQQCKVIILHIPGVGLSSMNPVIPLSLENIANAFKKVLYVLGIKDNVNLVASSFGTMVAQQMAYQFKYYIHSLVIISGFSEIDKKFKTDSISNAIQNDIIDLDDKEKQMINLSNYVNPSFVQFYSYLQQGNEYTTEQIVEQIVANTLVVYGEKDTVIEQSMFQHLASKIEGAKMHQVKNAGHLLNWTHSKEVNQIILEFLNQ